MNNDAINDMNPVNLNSLPPLDPPPALWASIRSELDQRQTARRHRRRTFIASAVAAVAVLAVVINLVQLPEPGPLLDGGGDTVAMSANESDLIQARQISALLEASLRRQNLGAGQHRLGRESGLAGERAGAWLDTRLASNPNDLDLWQQRNQLLEEMNQLYGRNSWQAQMQQASF